MCIKSNVATQASPAFCQKIVVSNKVSTFLRKDKKEQTILVYRDKNVDFFLKSTPQNVDYFDCVGSRQFAYTTQFGQTVFGSTCGVGNSKLWKNTLILDLGAGTLFFCPWDCPECYAKEQQKQYPNVYNHRILNSYLAKTNPALLFEYVDKCIQYYKPEYFRIHSSGEIPSWEYVVELCKLALKWRGIVKFYMFTKRIEFIPALEAAGINVVHSTIQDENGIWYINYGTKEYIKKFRKKFPFYKACPAILPDGTVRKEIIKTKNGKEKIVHKIRCGRDCILCTHYKYVCFYLHAKGKIETNDSIMLEAPKPAIVTSTSEIVTAERPPLVV